jgi:hypothetical protein
MMDSKVLLNVELKKVITFGGIEIDLILLPEQVQKNLIWTT